MADGTYNTKVYHKQGGDVLVVASGGTITEEPGGAILGRTILNTYLADAGTASSCYVICPFAGTIVQMQAVCRVANSTTKTVLTAKAGAGGTAVTHPAWEIAVTQAAGVVSSTVPTAANVVTAGQVIEILSDGGSASSGQITDFSITILRTS